MRPEKAKRLRGRRGFQVIIWGRASHKAEGETNFYGKSCPPPPPDTMSRSNYYYVFNTLFNTPEKYSRIFCILSLTHNIFIMVINKLTKLLKVSKLTKKLINWSQSVTSN